MLKNFIDTNKRINNHDPSDDSTTQIGIREQMFLKPKLEIISGDDKKAVGISDDILTVSYKKTIIDGELVVVLHPNGDPAAMKNMVGALTQHQDQGKRKE
jgi:hypothetical protein